MPTAQEGKWHFRIHGSGFPSAAPSRARNPCAQEGKPRVSAEPGGRSHRFATVRGVRRGRGQTRVFLHRFRFNCPAKQPCWPLGFGGLWVFSPAPQILAPRPQSPRSVSRRAAEKAKDAETPPLRHLFPFTSHLFPHLSPPPVLCRCSPPSRGGGRTAPGGVRARVVESSPRRVVETCFLRQPDNHDSSTHHQSPPP